MKSNLDILILFHNEDQFFVKRCFETAKDIQNFILIVDDFSDNEKSNMLIEEANVLKNYKIIKTPENLKQAGATTFGLKHLNAEYILRQDIDDIFTGEIPLNLPSDYDAFFQQNIILQI